MRKQFKKGVAILSAVSMVAAGISYVPENVKADAPAIAVQDSEEGVDYSSLTYTKAKPNGVGDFPELYYSFVTNELNANVDYLMQEQHSSLLIQQTISRRIQRLQ
ncbi:MAG: hypothetical protein ACLRR3_05200 [Eubacterium sp.]